METIVPDLIVDDGDGGPCFVAGTRITAADGTVCVENLTIGALVLTASGESRPVRWLGHRGVDCERHPDPTAVWPIRVQAGAFAPNQPTRDLWLSPRHAVFVDGVLIPVETLVNGATITQVPRDRVEYWHVELDNHDILLAEGLAAESYLDNGYRTCFANGGAFLEAHPDFMPKHQADTCVPLLEQGPEVERVKVILRARAEELGYVVTQNADVHLSVDGHRIEPLHLNPTRLTFSIAASAKTIELRCRTFVPVHMRPDSVDARSLGICVNRLQLDGTDVSLDDAAAFAQGWHDLEADNKGHRWRWSRDRAPLPAGTRLVIIDYAGGGLYRAEPPSELTAEPTSEFIALTG